MLAKWLARDQTVLSVLAVAFLIAYLVVRDAKLLEFVSLILGALFALMRGHQDDVTK